MHALINEQKGWKGDESQIHNMQYIILYTHIHTSPYLAYIHTNVYIYVLLKHFAFRHTIESASELKEHTHACDQLEGGRGKRGGGGQLLSWRVWCKSPLSQWVLVESRSPRARNANAARFGLSHACGVHRGIQALALCVSRLPGQSSNRSFISPTCTTPCQAHKSYSPSLPSSDAGMCLCSLTSASKREREREHICESIGFTFTHCVLYTYCFGERREGGWGWLPISKSRLYFFERVHVLHACAQDWYASARAQGFEFSFFDGVRVREELKSGFRI